MLSLLTAHCFLHLNGVALEVNLANELAQPIMLSRCTLRTRHALQHAGQAPLGLLRFSTATICFALTQM